MHDRQQTTGSLAVWFPLVRASGVDVIGADMVIMAVSRSLSSHNFAARAVWKGHLAGRAG